MDLVGVLMFPSSSQFPLSRQVPIVAGRGGHRAGSRARHHRRPGGRGAENDAAAWVLGQEPPRGRVSHGNPTESRLGGDASDGAALGVLLLGWCFEIFPKKSLTKSNTLTFGTKDFLWEMVEYFELFPSRFLIL